MRAQRTIWLTFCLLAMLLSAGLAAEPQCAVCGKAITGRYLTADGKSFCSQACFEQTLPKCDTCGRRLLGKFVRSEGRQLCQQCFDASLPRCELCGRKLVKTLIINGHKYCEEHGNSPGCSRCQLPFLKGYNLQDGRRLCHSCHTTAIFDAAPAGRLYRRAQNELNALTGLQLAALPPLELVGRDKMHGSGRDLARDNLVQRGLYSRHTETITYRNILGWTTKKNEIVTDKVLILYGLDADEFVSTAIHELGHAMFAEFFPQIHSGLPGWIEEGLCQYLAAVVCRRHGMAAALHAIEECKDAEYGDGYRFFKRIAGNDDWPKVRRWLEETDLSRLPAKAPSGN